MADSKTPQTGETAAPNADVKKADDTNSNANAENTGSTDTAASQGTSSEAPKTDAPAQDSNVTDAQRKVVAPPPPAPAPAPTQAKEAPKVIQPAVVVTETSEAVTDAQLPEVLEAFAVGTLQSQMSLQQLLTYAQDMAANKAQTPDTILQSQLRLLNSLHGIMSSEDTNFPVVWKAVIAIVKVHRNDAFSPGCRSRGLNSPESIKLIDNRNANFLVRIVDLLAVTAGLKTLEEVKNHVDFKTLEDTIFNVKARKNIIAFYSAS